MVTTSNSLDHTDVDDEIMRKNGKLRILVAQDLISFSFSVPIFLDASIKDMEGAAIAWVAEMHDVPFFGVKVITDLVDGERPTEVEFLENLQKAANSLQRSVPKIIEFIAGKSVNALN